MRKLFPVIALCLLPCMLTAQYILPKEVYSPAECRSIDSLERNQDYFIRKSKVKSRTTWGQDDEGKYVTEECLYNGAGLPLNRKSFWLNHDKILNMVVQYSYDNSNFLIEKVVTCYNFKGVPKGQWKESYSYVTLSSGLIKLRLMEQTYSPDYGVTNYVRLKRYNYNSKGWLVTVKDSGHFLEYGGTWKPFYRNMFLEYTYDKLGKPLKCIESKDGVLSGWEEVYSYNANAKPQKVVAGRKGEAPEEVHDYNYFTSGIRLSQDDFYNYGKDSTRSTIVYSEINVAGQFCKRSNFTTYYRINETSKWNVFNVFFYDNNGLLTKDMEEQRENGAFRSITIKSYTYLYY